jgi:hypothetical protein
MNESDLTPELCVSEQYSKEARNAKHMPDPVNTTMP